MTGALDAAAICSTTRCEYTRATIAAQYEESTRAVSEIDSPRLS